MTDELPLSTATLVAAVGVMLACGAGIAAIVLGYEPARRRRRRSRGLERERDIAAALGWSWRAWVSIRLAAIVIAVFLGWVTGVVAFAVVLLLGAAFGIPFLFAGRAARRRLTMDRAFMGVLRELRDRMAVSNQSLDAALLEIAGSPPPPLASALVEIRVADIATGVVACAERCRTPLIEQACGVLLWARTRSLDALIVSIDSVLLPIGEAQLAVEEEALVTLSQQRAVSFAMAALMAVMFASVMRVASFREYYQSPPGTVVLLASAALFAALIAAVSRLTRVVGWIRWDLRQLLATEMPDRA